MGCSCGCQPGSLDCCDVGRLEELLCALPSALLADLPEALPVVLPSALPTALSTFPASS